MKLIFTLSQNNYAKALTFSVLCLLFSATAQSQICANPSTIIYGIDGNGNIYPINVTNAVVGTKVNSTAYSTSPNQANGFGYNSVNGKFYYFAVNPGAGTQKFVSYDPSAGTYTTLASSPTTTTVHAGCVNFNGTGYYCTDINGKLYYYSILLNTWVTITSKITDQYGNNVSTVIQSQNSGDMAIDGLGDLWIITSSNTNYGLYKISSPLPILPAASIASTQIIAPTTATPSGNSIQGIAFNTLGQIYVGTGDDKLYLLKTSTTMTYVGALTTSGVGNDLTSCSFPVSILPVVWESFSVTLQSEKTVVLNWAVSQETNNKGFSVEHSKDGINWETIGFKPDNSDNNAASYSFTDANPDNGKNYYRIHQEDLDGNGSYSTVRTIDAETAGQVAVWPNPAKNILNIQQENGSVYNVNAQIFNQSGQKVSASVLHNGLNTVNISNLPAGYYIVHIDKSNGESYNQKLVKL